MNPNKNSLLELISDNLDQFFAAHDGDVPSSGLYNRIMLEVEKLLIDKTLKHTGRVQTKTAKILGINRNTLRKKIIEFKLEE